MSFVFTHVLKTAGLILLCVFTLAEVAQAQYVIKDGQPAAQIVIAKDAGRTTKLAASELQLYLHRITGGKLPIVSEPDPELVHLYVGSSPATLAMGITDDDLLDGAYRMISGENHLVLLGRDREFTPPQPLHPGGLLVYGQSPAAVAWDELTGARWELPFGGLRKSYNHELGIWNQDEFGSLNAVNAWLRDLGVRWYLPDALGEIVPQQRSVELPRVDRTSCPDFAMRNFLIYYRQFNMASRDEVLWQLRLGMTPGQRITGFDWSLALSHGIQVAYHRDEIREAHPDWFGLYGGTRDNLLIHGKRTGKPCLKSEGLFQENLRYLRFMFDQYDVPMVSVMPVDGYGGICQCELCNGQATPQRGSSGSMSDYVWDYVNRVAIELYKTHPDRKISCFAYATYLLPPASIKQLSPNIVVGLCQWRSMFQDPEQKKRFDDIRQSWLQILPEGSRKFMIWDYYLHGRPSSPYEAMPVFYPHQIADDLRSLRDISLGDFIEVYRERNQSLHQVATNHLNLYVTARMQWDTSLDVDALLEEYYTLYYGPAREEMKAFVEFCEANFRFMPRDAKAIRQAQTLLAAAIERVPEGSPYAQRIALIDNYMKPLNALAAQLEVGRKNVPEIRTQERKASQFTIDGKVDDAGWEGLPIYHLKELRTGANPTFYTSFQIAWDQETQAFYINVICKDQDNGQLNTMKLPADDMNIFNGDCVEILLETQEHSYYQLVVNPSGAFVDIDRSSGIEAGWSSRAEVASHVGNGFWSAELRIPVIKVTERELDPDGHGFAGRKPTEVYPWYINVCRQRVRPNGNEVSAWSPTGTNHFHDVMKFGKLHIR